MKLVGEERGGTGEERQGRSFSSASVSRVWTDRQEQEQEPGAVQTRNRYKIQS